MKMKMPRKEEPRVGCFQVLLLFLLAINCIIVAMSHALPAFHNYTPRFYCENSERGNKWYGCAQANASKNLTFDDPENSELCTTEYTFVTDNGERSVVTDWGLVCEKSYLKSLGTVVYYLGVSIGALIAGILADRVGRLPVLAICLYVHGTMAVATYIVQSYPVFLGLRGLQGVFAQGLYCSTYILIVELFPTKYRTLVFSVMGVAWSLGLLLLATLSYIILDWRILQLAVSVPTAITVLYIGIVPESPRWLLAKGKTTEADMAIEKITKYNSCCCGKSRKELVADNSEITTPVRPERKSRVFNETKETTESEAANLLTPTNSGHRNSRSISLRAISENLEKRLSNLAPETFDVNNEEEMGESSTSRSNRSSKVLPEDLIIEDTKDMEEFNNSMEMDLKAVKNTVENIPIDENNETEETEEKTPNKFGNVFVIKYSFIMALQWFSVSLMNAIVLNTIPNLLNNRHINFALGGIIELVIYPVIYFILSRSGRRLPLAVFQSLNGIICIVIVCLVFLPSVTVIFIDIGRTTLLLAARITSTSTLGIVYLYTLELFPTVLRGTCLGFFTIIGTIGYLSAPHIEILGNFVIMGHLILASLLCVFSGFSCFIMPETMDKLLSDTLEEMKIMDICRKICHANENDAATEREALRDKLFSEDWVDAGNGIIVNFSDNRN